MSEIPLTLISGPLLFHIWTPAPGEMPTAVQKPQSAWDLPRQTCHVLPILFQVCSSTSNSWFSTDDLSSMWKKWEHTPGSEHSCISHSKFTGIFACLFLLGSDFWGERGSLVDPSKLVTSWSQTLLLIPRYYSIHELFIAFSFSSFVPLHFSAMNLLLLLKIIILPIQILPRAAMLFCLPFTTLF